MGIRQFLDIGTGIPAANNTHEVAQSLAPESRVVYVDNDPIVLVHARALLNSTKGPTAYLDADLRDTGKILEAAARTLDFSQPVAVMLLMILHLIPDSDDPYGIVRRLMDATAPGSYLVLSHPASDIDADGRREGGAALQRARLHPADPAHAMRRSAASSTASTCSSPGSWRRTGGGPLAASDRRAARRITRGLAASRWCDRRRGVTHAG